MMRIGIGSDIHKLVRNRPLIIGGITVPHIKGAQAHSDGDAVLHALTDALLGALALGDIGEHFPPHDSRYKNISSSVLLKNVLALPAYSRWQIVNIDIIIELQNPRLSPYKEAIRRNIAALAGLPPEAVAVKAKTGEKLDAVGKGRAIKAQAAVLLQEAAGAP
jgi:2-C-methyl-D-erythritol 2,4-cyclodiphosphate synthase